MLMLTKLEAYSESSLTSKMEFLAEIVNDWKPLTIFTKNSILDVRLGSEYLYKLSDSAKNE